MMHRNNIEMVTVVPKDELLKTLRANLEKHAAVVKEARAGYMKKARSLVETELRKLERMNPQKPTALALSLSPPQDYSSVYETAVKMLEWTTEQTVELKADEFRQLVMDEWDWKLNFMHSNATYSKRAFDWYNESSAGGALVAPPDLEDQSVGESYGSGR